MRLKALVEYCVTRRLVTFAELDAILRDLRRRGKPGIRKLLRVLDALDGEPPPASVAERWLAEAVAMAGLRATRQYPLPWSREPVLGLTDAALPEAKLILEADSRTWHGRLAAIANDRRRDVAAALAGWDTLRFVYEHLRDDRPGAARDIREVHDQRVALLHA
jgi:very-short-patch-repair endonuclease